MATVTEHRLKMALWAVPIIFSCGGFWALMTSTSSQLTHEVAEVQVELQEHTKLKAHPVTEERIDTILTEQRDIRDEQKVQGQNLAAICSATGASCK